MSAKEIIKELDGNGGIDVSFVKWNARQERKSPERYLYEYIKACYNCHGNTANAVVRYYL